jgi:hypothetical protein
MITPREAAEAISARAGRRVHVQTVYTWIRSKALKSKRLCHRILIDPKELDIFLANHSDLDGVAINEEVTS